MNDVGRVLMLAGGALFFMGLLLYLTAGRIPGLGNLPGDFRYEGDNFTIFFPLGTMIVLSLILTILFNVIGRFFR